METLKGLIKKEFRRLLELPFDELSVAHTTQITTDMYDRLLKANKKEYEKIADDAIEYALAFLEEEELQRYLDNPIKVKEFTEQVLKKANPVTNYYYYKEADRKRLRLAEGMNIAKEYRQRPSFRQIIETNTNLWYTQTKQYAEDIADATVMEVWRRAGITKIAWITEEDERVCSICDYLGHDKHRNIKLYDLDKVPPKPHYNCRCIKLPVRVDKIITPKGE